MYDKRLMLAYILWFLLDSSVCDVPEFDILAPPFLCPKENDVIIDKPDFTVITLQTDAYDDIVFKWTVRWSPILSPTQRFVLALWKTVRALENQLNGVQSEPGVYIINNTELLSGVKYIFNVTAAFTGESEFTEKSFHIDNMQGNQKLLIEGRSDMFSIVLIGGHVVYADEIYMIEAQVLTCYKTQDYYFMWSVSSSDNKVNMSDTKGSKLEIKAGSLKPGLTYNVLCKLYKFSNKECITENSLTFRVIHRDINLNFNFDVLVIPSDTPFYVRTDINKIDYRPAEISVSWECTFKDRRFNDYEHEEYGTLFFPSGLPYIGEYYVSITVVVLNNDVTTNATARIKTVHPRLPVIEVYNMPRMINEGDFVNLQANVSHIVPGCQISWYFIYNNCLSSANTTIVEMCIENEHGIPVSDPINFYSLDENFLSELIDYSNETAGKYVGVDIQAATGTARIVAHCECNSINNCSSEGTVYADIKLSISKKPRNAEVLIMPETGTAMETIFRLSTHRLQDSNRPLRYTFYCDLGNNVSLVLGDYMEYLAVETMLPYVDADNGTAVWVEVCNSLGTCSFGVPTRVKLAPGKERAMEQLIDDMKAFLMRCELMILRRLVVSAIVTYMNAGQTDTHKKFTSVLLETFEGINQDCIETSYEQYNELLYWLTRTVDGL